MLCGPPPGVTPPTRRGTNLAGDFPRTGSLAGVEPDCGLPPSKALDRVRGGWPPGRGARDPRNDLEDFMARHRVLPAPGLVLGAAAILAASFALAGCNDDNPTNPTPSGPTATVHIVLNAMSKGASAYSPNPDTVAVGTTVIWRNDDTITHTVTTNT